MFRGAWAVHRFLALPAERHGWRLTWKRLRNLYHSRWESRRLRPVLRSWPTRLVVEPTNACNLRCPYCHTGAGRFGRPPGMLDVERYRAVLDEIGDYLFELELFNWGEALLHPRLPELIAVASARGIATRVNTNLSVHLGREEAERLVDSGLSDLFVSIDGPTQEVYERYRVGGDLGLVRHNCRLIAEARARRGRETPRLTLQFLEFPFNQGELERMRALADELGMRLWAFRGAVPAPEWGKRYGSPPWWMEQLPGPCPFLWEQPVLTVDGNVAPCRGVFRSFDDVTSLAGGPGEAGARSFREAWNHDRYRRARALFQGRTGMPEDRALPCYDCPTTLIHERWRSHRQAGGTDDTFDPGMERSSNGAWNYFWARGQRETAPDA